MTSYTDVKHNRELPIVRKLIVSAKRAGKKVKEITNVFGISRQMVWKWTKRAKHRGTESSRDKPRKPKESKITPEVEGFILFLRVVFAWGTGRIQNGLISLPKFMYDSLPQELRHVNGVHLSRTAINNLLKKHKRNGYQCHKETWKFFIASRPNELWQLDLKGPVTLFGKEYYFVICIDDYSRYLLLAVQLDHCPTTMLIPPT